jgi:chromatin remodeling complex protein RSC6
LFNIFLIKFQWEKSPKTPDFDGFEIKRKGDSNTVANIYLYLDHQITEKYKLAPELGEVLGVQVDTKHNIMLALWQYIRVIFFLALLNVLIY